MFHTSTANPHTQPTVSPPWCCTPPCCRGFTNYARPDFQLYREEGRLVNDGCHVRMLDHKGPLAKRDSGAIFKHPAKKHNICYHGEAEEAADEE